jgi:hypothetical protein
MHATMNRSWLNNANVCLIICYIFSSRFCWYNNGNAFMFTPSSSFLRSSKNSITKGIVSPALTFTTKQASSSIIRKAISDKNDNDVDNNNNNNNKSSSSSWEIKNRPQDVNIADFLDTASFLSLKVLDTIEDAYTHLRRLQAEESYIDTSSTVVDCLEQWNSDTDPRPKLLVIGSGWASHA